MEGVVWSQVIVNILLSLSIALPVLWLAYKWISKVIKKRFNKRVKEMIDKSINKCALKEGIKLEEFEGRLGRIEESVVSIASTLERMQLTSKERELMRIRESITKFAGRLRRGEEPSILEFRSTMEQYDYYHDNGGNTYVDGEFEFIKGKYDELFNH